jgi:hypothetical protein
MDTNSNDENQEVVANPVDETLHQVSQVLEGIAMQQDAFEQGVNNGFIVLFNMSDDVTPFRVNLNEPIRDIINRATSGVRSDNFHLELKNGICLNSNKTLREAGVDLGANIRLVEGGITPDSGIFSAPPSPASSDTYNQINPKSEIESVVDVNEIDNLLEQEMSDSGTIVVTEMDGTFREVSIAKSDTVNEVITRIFGQDNEEFDLLNNGRPLPRHITLRDAGIPFGRNLNTREREIQIFVRLVDGRNITINARRSQTVLYLKERVRDQIQVPLHQQRLQYQSKPLEDQRTLKSYSIRNGASVESTYRLRGGSVF